MIIFPLSWLGKIVLIIIAVFLGMIWSMLQWPDWWIKRLRKNSKSKFLKELKEKKEEE